MITGKTVVCGLIGDPVEHTLSPAMQNAAFAELGLDLVYLPFRVKRENIGQAIQAMRALNLRGLNVTIPHKVAVMPFLDEVDAMAANIGAVNTIVNQDGHLKGLNTDAAGFLQALNAAEINPCGQNVVVLGAGGASRAISFVLSQKQANLTILNRHSIAAKEIADKISHLFHKNSLALELNLENLKSALSEAHILINTTSVGMSPNDNSTPVPASLLKKDLMVFDIIYIPLHTRLMKESAKIGAKTIGGSEMLIWQGAVAFKAWTNIEPPVETMRHALLKVLGSNEN